jgi:transcriptional regulator with XRE-family HTH domain
LPAIVRTKAHRALISVLVACRREAGLTQADLAERCRKPQTFIASIESGQRGVQVAELPMLAKGLGVPEIRLYKLWLAFRGA